MHNGLAILGGLPIPGRHQRSLQARRLACTIAVTPPLHRWITSTPLRNMRRMFAVAIFWGVLVRATASTTTVSKTINATPMTFTDDQYKDAQLVMSNHSQAGKRSSNNKKSSAKLKINSTIEGPNDEVITEPNYEYNTNVNDADDDYVFDNGPVDVIKHRQQVTTATTAAKNVCAPCTRRSSAIVIFVLAFTCIALMVSTIILGCKVFVSSETKKVEVQQDHLICISAMSGETQPFAFDLVTGAALPEPSGSMHRMSLHNTRTLV